MNRFLILPAVITAAFVLVGCAHRGNPCDGFAPQRPKSATIDYLYQNDPGFADSVAEHNAQGAARCGWKARP